MYKLSKPQEAIFELSRFSNDSATNIAGDIFFNFPVSVEAARDTAYKYFQICDTFFTQIVMVNGVPMQQTVKKEVTVDDICFREFETYSEYENWAKADAVKPIDIFGCLYRLSVVKVGEKVGFYCVTHHIINDATSFNIMARFACEYLQGNKEQFFYSYKEYLDAEEKYEQSSRYKKDKDYWINIYNNVEINFFVEKNETDQKASRKSHYISDSLSERIREFCKNNEITEYVFFLTVIAAYYNRITQKSTFFIGSPVLNRNNIKDQKTMGVFINTVPIGFLFEEDELFTTLCAKTENNVMSAFRHQKYHYSQLLKDINRCYGISKKMFDVSVSFLNTKTADGAEIGWFSNGKQIESLQIHIDDRRSEGFYHVNYDYQTEKFSEHDIDMLHEHICTLLSDALENENKKICDLEILTPNEKQKILFDFNDTKVDYPRDKCIHKLFEETAENTPDKIAIVACDKTLTYRELNREANKIAHALTEKGIGVGDIVAFSLKRKSYLVSAIFGILKAGAAYLPIDPDFPESRIEYILSDSGAECLITDSLVEDWLRSDNISNLQLNISSESPCYCIYTSGSTGRPKGSIICHRNLMNFCSDNDVNHFQHFVARHCNNILSCGAITFDICTTEIMLALTLNKTLVLADETDLLNIRKLATLFNQHRIDCILSTPTKLFTYLLNSFFAQVFADVKCVLVAGEQLTEEVYNTIKMYCNARIFNGYGPTETAMGVSIGKINKNDITIGRPIANTQIYIVDKYMNPVPVGVAGELCIAGDCVGAGYLNRPELTAEKFITNPFGEGKLYKTCDIAYWREDGNIVFVGRNDFQVKIRGLRIELGEIENAISSIDGINLSVVVVRNNSEGRQLICAFYTGEEKTARKIKDIIGEKLPKYMLPHIFTHLAEMPLTTSGKINRNELPEIDLENISTETEFVAPSTEKEILLTECICEIMGSQKISVLDNFFDIGGDSLKAIALTAKLEEKGYTVGIKTIFSCKDIQELASVLEEKESEEIHIEYGNVIPATAAQMRVYTAQKMNPNSAHYNIPYVFSVKELDAQKLEESINTLIERHESFRTRFESRDGQIVQIIDDKASITVQKLTSDDVHHFNTTFDIEKAPLIRAGYFENTVIIVTHHLIADGESMNVFFRELNEVYMGRELKQTVQYGEFAVTDTYSEENEKYWLNLFEGELLSADIRTDFPRPAVKTFEGSQIYERIDGNLQKRITEKCKTAGITPYVYYMACYGILISKYSGNEDIVIGTPVSGRSSRYLETVGMFVNTIPIRINSDGNRKVSELLNEIKDSSVKAIDNQRYPLGELIRKLGLDVSVRNPFADIMFAYQSEQMTVITFGDSLAEILPVTLGGVKCDLNFSLMSRHNDVVIMAEYSTDLFKESTVNEFISSYKMILETALDETKLIKDIDVLSADDRKKLLYDFNSTQHNYKIPYCSTLYTLFEKTAKENPDKICIRTEKKHVSYGELLSITENLDVEIRNITGEKKSVIAVIAERSVEMYGAIYGIIRGGNAYLPIEPDYPPERIDYILENSNAAAVIAQGKFVQKAGTLPCINMTEFLKTAKEEQILVSECEALPDDTAYVIYTSGSTGNPKGAMVSHKSAVNRILWMHDRYPLESDDVILQKTPYTFDVSVWEHFWWGMCGGCLAASKPGEHFLPAKILDEVCKNKVTHLHFVPSVFELFLNYLETHKEESNKFDSVRYVFLSGETLTANLVNRFYKLYDHSKVTLHNLYGPTECAVDVTYYDCVPEDNDPVPIGKPIYNTQMYVVDKYCQPVPIGVTGELCIAGDNVGQGYLGNLELTAEKFIDNPFGEGKLYKTGDLAYWREDGNIVFVGRTDFQMKLNGQRLELGEIESVISDVTGINSATVIVKKVNGKDILIAFYAGEELDVSYIKECCIKKLPRYMVPNTFMHLDELPLNQSGKLDRKALAQKEVEITIEYENEDPVNETEKFICEAFEKVLCVKGIGRNSDFFEIGGTSLSMISLLSEAGFEDVSAAEFMRNSIPAMLSSVITTKQQINLKYLEPLYISDRTKQVMILMPFAGGGAESYSMFVNSLKKKNNSISVYFMRYLHSLQECQNAADEIADVLGESEIFIYSHCVGSAVSLQVISFLESKNVSVKQYFAGASIPPAKAVKKNIWNVVPDKIIKSILVKAGADIAGLTDDRVCNLLERFRKDTDFANVSFTEFKGKINVSVSVIVSKKDIFTKNYRSAERLWKKYATNVANVKYIDSNSHYFQSDNSEFLIDMLLTMIV